MADTELSQGSQETPMPQEDGLKPSMFELNISVDTRLDLPTLRLLETLVRNSSCPGALKVAAFEALAKALKMEDATFLLNDPDTELLIDEATGDALLVCPFQLEVLHPVPQDGEHKRSIAEWMRRAYTGQVPKGEVLIGAKHFDVWAKGKTKEELDALGGEVFIIEKLAEAQSAPPTEVESAPPTEAQEKLEALYQGALQGQIPAIMELQHIVDGKNPRYPKGGFLHSTATKILLPRVEKLDRLRETAKGSDAEAEEARNELANEQYLPSALASPLRPRDQQRKTDHGSHFAARFVNTTYGETTWTGAILGGGNDFSKVCFLFAQEVPLPGLKAAIDQRARDLKEKESQEALSALRVRLSKLAYLALGIVLGGSTVKYGPDAFGYVATAVKDLEEAEESAAPTEEAAAPTEEAAAPTEEAAAPTEEAPASTEEAAAPTEEAAAPTEEAPASTEEAAAPTEEAAAPTEEAPASTEEAAAPTERSSHRINFFWLIPQKTN